MIDHEKLALAHQTISMGQSPAFLDMLNGIRADSERLERETLSLGKSDSDHATRIAFLTWQAHKSVVKAMEDTIQNAILVAKEIEEEIDYERTVERDRGTRGNWNS